MNNKPIIILLLFAILKTNAMELYKKYANPEPMLDVSKIDSEKNGILSLSDFLLCKIFVELFKNSKNENELGRHIARLERTCHRLFILLNSARAARICKKIIIILMMSFQNEYEFLFKLSLQREPFIKKKDLLVCRLNNKSAKQIYKKTYAHLRAYGIGNVLLQIIHVNLVPKTA